MTEESCPRSSEEPAAAAASATKRQRKKRKWDQPAESLISVGLVVPGALPLGVGVAGGVGMPSVVPLSSPILANSVAAACATATQLYQAPVLQQAAAAIIQKISQPKIQDELIAREIIINDADAAIRCKLTKRQIQEEIQKCTGAVVITRGRYRPPNALPDNDKPLYLHISAGAHLKDTAGRIKAVDYAASIVEEILKHGHSSQLVSSYNSVAQVIQPQTKCIYLGFDPDPTLNIAARIRGPNDQYINHIMNETGATVILRGQGSGNSEHHAGDVQDSLHLYLSASNLKSLEDAAVLAENLLDTISLECGVSRMSGGKAYKAVPPPLKLLDGVEKSASVLESHNDLAMTKSSTATPVSLGSNVIPPVSVLPSVSGGTSYSGYGGIYPQATPLQQVALALRQAPASPAVPTTSTCMLPKVTSTSTDKDKRSQRRKFQELPVALSSPLAPYKNSRQGSESLKPGVSDDLPGKDASSLPAPNSIQFHCNGMPPPPQKLVPPPPPPEKLMPPPPPPEKLMPPPPPPEKLMPPPPPPKFTAPKLPSKDEHENGAPKAPSTKAVPDTLMKLMEYGEEDEDGDVSSEYYSKCSSTLKTTSKPFWAV